MYNPDKAHYIAVTAIVVNTEGKYLIAKRADWEKDFPGKWTVPGGKLEVSDYQSRPQDSAYQWYNVLEYALTREIKEEVGLDVNDFGYITSLVFVRKDTVPCLVISMYALATSEAVVLSKDLAEYMWVTLPEAKNYDLIDGIYDEIRMLDEFLKTGKKGKWQRI